MPNFDNSLKRPTNLSRNAKVPGMARELGTNVSQTLDTLLAQAVQRRYWERWNEQNKDAIAAYNERIGHERLRRGVEPCRDTTCMHTPKQSFGLASST